MATQQLSVTLPSGTLYVSGTVNGVATTWTNTTGNVWETVADRASNDIYLVALTIINSAGTTTTAELTLYYGVLNLITDRTQADVARVSYLNGLFFYDAKSDVLVWTGTDDELTEWKSGLKGAYNASDLNRVGAAVEYLAGRLAEVGYLVEVSPKKDWMDTDIPYESDMADYLAQVATLRGVLPLLTTTPELPEDMDRLTYTEANDIEQILVDLDFLLTNMSQAWFYSGDLYAGEM